MTIDELVEKLKEIQNEGKGHYEVVDKDSFCGVNNFGVYGETTWDVPCIVID
jgi:hypothetical protein